jgi:DNA polymerase beta
MDILMTSDVFTLKKMVKTLLRNRIITDILSLQNEKFMGVAHCPNDEGNHFRLDIEFLPKEEIPYGLLYFTGSKDFNKEIRQHAKNKGYTLNQHGLKNNMTGDYIKANSEEDIFNFLEVQYLQPNKRE